MTRKQTVGENLLYVMVWAAIILVPVLNSQMMSELHISFENVLIAWRQIAPYFIIFIIHNSVLAPRLMLRRKYKTYLLCDLALIIAVFWLVNIYEEHLTDRFLPHGDPEAFDAYRKASFSNLEMYWHVVLEAEMDYLKYQINPHFFMNTLNNIHALIDIDTEYAKSAVIELSKMMRYVLYESGHEIISLNRDIQFVQNYIGLMRIRYTDAVDIRVEYPHDLPPQISIPPLLIVFVENAFKHGVSYSKPSFIHLRIDYADGKVVSTIGNSLHSPQAEKHNAGIGLENVRKRLSLIYGPKNYSLDIEETKETYTVKLVIPTLNA